MQISGDKTIEFLTQQYMFANVFVSLDFRGTEFRTGSVPEVQKDPQGPIFRL